MASSPIPGWFTPDDAADILGIHPDLVRRYCRDKKLKAKPIGRYWFIKEGDLTAFASKPRPRGNPTFQRQGKRQKKS